VYKKILKPQMC